MLTSLYIKDFALFDEVMISFQKGLNIITGETGAGKSLIVDALNMLLGEKTDRSILRKNAPKAIVEGVFSLSLPEITVFLSEHDLDILDHEIRVRREVHASGRSRSFINDTPVTAEILRAFGELLVDIHGQHEHQSLLKNEKHIEYLDAFAGLQSQVQEIGASYRKIRSLKKDVQFLIEKGRQLEERRDYLQFQLDEIKRIQPLPGEDEALEREERILANSEKLFGLSSDAYQLLYENEPSAYELLTRVESILSELQQIDKQFEEFAQLSTEAKINVDEIAKFLQHYTTHFEFNPERLEKIRNRLNTLARLKKKYGSTIEDILEKKAAIEKELRLVDSVEDEVDQLKKKIDAEIHRYTELAEIISGKRKAAAQKLKLEIEGLLKKLGMEKAVFRVQVEPLLEPDGWVKIGETSYQGTARGIDRVRFFFSANPGEAPRELSRIASGGEISRVMLSIKSVLAEKDRIPVLIFDEIDNGISGRIAQTVGRQLHALAESHQIICVTHLPQIASAGDAHYTVEKTFEANRTHTKLRALNESERVVEIAKLIGGEKISDVNLKSAEELLKAFENS
ncbi:MAG: DNA repair protein RecN [Calditrichaeota bacterium]|nr:DNA repair protein RecN [Calditrichota bacterium]